MPTVWPDSSVVNIHPHSERVLGSSSGRVMGGWGCVDDTCEEKAYDQMGTRNPGPITHRPCKYSDHLANGPHDEPASSTIYTAG